VDLSSLLTFVDSTKPSVNVSYHYTLVEMYLILGFRLKQSRSMKWLKASKSFGQIVHFNRFISRRRFLIMGVEEALKANAMKTLMTELFRYQYTINLHAEATILAESL
jgi:hypothetical protein